MTERMDETKIAAELDRALNHYADLMENRQLAKQQAVAASLVWDALREGVEIVESGAANPRIAFANCTLKSLREWAARSRRLVGSRKPGEEGAA